MALRWLCGNQMKPKHLIQFLNSSSDDLFGFCDGYSIDSIGFLVNEASNFIELATSLMFNYGNMLYVSQKIDGLGNFKLLPKEISKPSWFIMNFPKFLSALFVVWSLIIRNCYGPSSIPAFNTYQEVF